MLGWSRRRRRARGRGRGSVEMDLPASPERRRPARLTLGQQDLRACSRLRSRPARSARSTTTSRAHGGRRGGQRPLDEEIASWKCRRRRDVRNRPTARTPASGTACTPARYFQLSAEPDVERGLRSLSSQDRQALRHYASTLERTPASSGRAASTGQQAPRATRRVRPCCGWLREPPQARRCSIRRPRARAALSATQVLSRSSPPARACVRLVRQQLLRRPGPVRGGTAPPATWRARTRRIGPNASRVVRTNERWAVLGQRWSRRPRQRVMLRWNRRYYGNRGCRCPHPDGGGLRVRGRRAGPDSSVVPPRWAVRLPARCAPRELASATAIERNYLGWAGQPGDPTTWRGAHGILARIRCRRGYDGSATVRAAAGRSCTTTSRYARPAAHGRGSALRGPEAVHRAADADRRISVT